MAKAKIEIEISNLNGKYWVIKLHRSLIEATLIAISGPGSVRESIKSLLDKVEADQ